ncbi:MAG: hypothetical protein V4635_09085 [Bacteroidota bacterium]
MSSLSHLSYLFIGEDRLNEKDFYYLIIDRKDREVSPSPPDVFIKRTVALCLFQFFTDNREAVIVFNYTNADGKINAKRGLFKRWFDEYSTDSVYKFYQHDFRDVASICALYRRYSAHVNFVDVETKIQSLIIQIATDTSKG